MIEPKVTSSGCLKWKEDTGVGSLMEGSISNFSHQLLNLFRHFNRKKLWIHYDLLAMSIFSYGRMHWKESEVEVE